MTAQKKQPTNAEILKEIREVKIMQTAQAKDIAALNQWKLQEDAYKAALVQVHKEQDRQGGTDKFLNKELMKALGLALTAIVSLVALIQASK